MYVSMGASQGGTYIGKQVDGLQQLLGGDGNLLAYQTPVAYAASPSVSHRELSHGDRKKKINIIITTITMKFVTASTTITTTSILY